MTWGVSTARRRPGELLTRGDVCHLHADRDGAERCGAAGPGAPDLVRLEQYGLADQGVDAPADLAGKRVGVHPDSTTRSRVRRLPGHRGRTSRGHGDRADRRTRAPSTVAAEPLMEVRGARSSWLTIPSEGGDRACILGRLTWRCPVRIRRLVPILGLAASLVSPASAQNPGALHWRQKTGLGVMLAGVVAIGIAHERHAPDPLRRLRPIGGGLVVAGAVVALLPVPEPVRPDVAVGPAGWTVGKTWSWGAGGRDPRHDGAAGAGGDLDKSTTWSTVDLPAPDDEFGGSEARRVRRCRGPARPARRWSRRARGSWISLPLTLPPLQSRTSAAGGPGSPRPCDERPRTSSLVRR